MFILTGFENHVHANSHRISETLKIDRDKHNNRCEEITTHKNEDKDVSFGEILHKVIQNCK